MRMKARQIEHVTMAQIAKEAGVSTTTVSKVLNQLPGVGDQTRARIQQVIEQHGYVQNHAARHLRKGQSGLIELVIMRLEGGYDLGIMRGVQDALEQSGHRLVVFATHEEETLERLWLRRILDQSTDGVLLLLPYERIGIAEALAEQDIPFVAWRLHRYGISDFDGASAHRHHHRPAAPHHLARTAGRLSRGAGAREYSGRLHTDC